MASLHDPRSNEKGHVDAEGSPKVTTAPVGGSMRGREMSAAEPRSGAGARPVGSRPGCRGTDGVYAVGLMALAGAGVVRRGWRRRKTSGRAGRGAGVSCGPKP